MDQSLSHHNYGGNHPLLYVYLITHDVSVDGSTPVFWQFIVIQTGILFYYVVAAVRIDPEIFMPFIIIMGSLVLQGFLVAFQPLPQGGCQFNSNQLTEDDNIVSSWSHCYHTRLEPRQVQPVYRLGYELDDRGSSLSRCNDGFFIFATASTPFLESSLLSYGYPKLLPRG